ncbi:MAG: VOC family protein [Mycobacteriales bacterium]
MTISGLHHAMLTVSDLDRSNDFYGGVLGLKTFRAIPDDGVVGAKVIFGLPDGNFFGIVQHSRGDKSRFDEMRTGLDHISFTVAAEDLGSWQERFREAAISASEPAPAASGELVIVVRDPDNIQIQIFGRRS